MLVATSWLTWYQIFLVKMHLSYSIWSSSSVSVASYSFINLLFIIIIFFVLGLTALVNLALTNYILFLNCAFFFFSFSWRTWLSNFSLFSSKLASPSSSLFYLFKVSFWDDSLINVVLPACIACALLKGIAWTILPWASLCMLHILLFKRGRSVLLVRTATCVQIAEDGILSRAEDLQ